MKNVLLCIKIWIMQQHCLFTSSWSFFFSLTPQNWLKDVSGKKVSGWHSWCYWVRICTIYLSSAKMSLDLCIPSVFMFDRFLFFFFLATLTPPSLSRLILWVASLIKSAPSACFNVLLNWVVFLLWSRRHAGQLCLQNRMRVRRRDSSAKSSSSWLGTWVLFDHYPAVFHGFACFHLSPVFVLSHFWILVL